MVGRGYTCIHMQYLQGWSPCLRFTCVCLYLCLFIWRALLVLPNSVVVPTQQAGEQAYTSLYTYYIKRPLSMCNTSDLLTLLTHLMLRHLEFIFVFCIFCNFSLFILLLLVSNLTSKSSSFYGFFRCWQNTSYSFTHKKTLLVRKAIKKGQLTVYGSTFSFPTFLWSFDPTCFFWCTHCQCVHQTLTVTGLPLVS